MRNYDDDTWKLRILCRQTLQDFWFQRVELKDVLEVYCIERTDECHDHVVKLLLKTKKDFINGFSFFTREDIDGKVLKLMQKYRHRCMKD